MRDNSQLIDFISKDTKATANKGWLRVVLTLAIMTISFAFIVISGLNEALSFHHSWEVWVMATLFLAGMIAFAKALFSPQINLSFWFSILAILLASFLLPQWSASFTTTQNPSQFWSDSLNCFLFGASASALTAGVLTALLYLSGPVPSRSTRVVLNTVCGISGTTALFFTCPNADLGHLFTGHGSQIVVLVSLTFLLNEFILSRLVRAKLGNAAARFKSFRTFDKN